MTQIKELTLQLSDVASTKSPITGNKTKVGSFWWSSFKSYSLFICIPAPSSAQLCASAAGSSIPTGHSKPTSEKIIENVDGILSLSKCCDIKSGKSRRISDPLTKIFIQPLERKFREDRRKPTQLIHLLTLTKMQIQVSLSTSVTHQTEAVCGACCGS